MCLRQCKKSETQRQRKQAHPSHWSLLFWTINVTYSAFSPRPVRIYFIRQIETLKITFFFPCMISSFWFSFSFARENKMSPVTCTVFLIVIESQVGETHSPLAFSLWFGAQSAGQHSLLTQASHLSALTQHLHLSDILWESGKLFSSFQRVRVDISRWDEALNLANQLVQLLYKASV